MKLSIYIRNKDMGPSCYYRICQYLDSKSIIEYHINEYSSLNSYKLCRKLDKYPPLSLFYKGYLYIIGLFRRIISMIWDIKFRKVDIVFIQREIFPKTYPLILNRFLEKYLQKINCIIWDFDDYIKQDGEISINEYNLLCKYSKYIIVSTEYLKNTIPTKYQHKCNIICTTDKAMQDIDLESINKERMKVYEKEIRLVWVGTNSNIKYLEEIISHLDKVARHFEGEKKIILNIVSNGTINVRTNALEIRNISWSREVALKILTQSHIGLMPLKLNEYTLGKAGFKAVQCIGMGLPTIVSNVGYNSDVIRSGVHGYVVDNDDEWSKYIIDLCENKMKWLQFSEYARDYWNEYFNADYNRRYILSIIEQNTSY